MQYSVLPPSAFAVFYSELLSLNMKTLDTVWVAVKGKKGAEPIYVEFKDCGEQPHYPKELISDYLAQGISASDYSAVAIPLAEFSAITDWSCIDRLNLIAHNEIGSGQGTIYVDEIRFLPARVLVDDFQDPKPLNQLGAASGYWNNETGKITYGYPQGVLQLDYDVTITTPVAEAIYWTGLRNTNLLLRKDALLFQVRGDQGSEEIAVEFRDCGLSGTTHIPKIKVSDYLIGGVAPDWRGVAIPLAAFADGMDWRCVEQVNILASAKPWLNSGQGTVFVDDIILAPASHPIPLLVDRFDDCDDWNALTWAWSSGTIDQAHINFGPDAGHRSGSSGCGYRITYEVIGTSGAWLRSELKGLDVRDYTHLRFLLKGAVGDEELHVYLWDSNGNKRYYEDIKTTNNWQEILIPLKYFSPPVNLANLSELTIAFEWKTMSGTIYIDDMSFIKPQTFLPIAMKDYRDICPDSMPTCSSPYNNYEPNNYRCSTTFALSSGVPIQSYICSPDDKDDYYYIEVTTLNPITVRLTNIPRGVDYDLYLYWGDSIVARSDNFGNANDAFTYTPSQPGIYFIRVRPYSGHSLSPYTLQADFQ
jgi:hypothetical protein